MSGMQFIVPTFLPIVNKIIAGNLMSIFIYLKGLNIRHKFKLLNNLAYFRRSRYRNSMKPLKGFIAVLHGGVVLKQQNYFISMLPI